LTGLPAENGEGIITIIYDEKGKLYTNIVLKQAQQVKIQTTSQLLTGTIHIREEFRLKDELDLPEPFIALTGVKVFSPKGKIELFANFLAVRRDQIVWVSEDEDLQEVKDD